MDSYRRYAAAKGLVMLALVVSIGIASLIALSAGSMSINPYEVFRAITGQGADVADIVIWQIRLPRILAAIIAGAGLSVAGCVMQNNLRNQLASPSTLGIANAAAFGANMAIIVFGAGSVRSTGADAVYID